MSFDQASFRLGFLARLALGLALALTLWLAFSWSAGLTALFWGVVLSGFGLLQWKSPETRPGQIARHILALIEPGLWVGALWLGDLFDKSHPTPPGMLFFSPAPLLLLIPIALAALSTRPTLVVSSGAGVLIAWTGARLAALADPGTLTKQQVIDEEFDSLIDYLGAITQPRYFDKDVWLLEMVAFAAITVALAVATWRTRTLARKAAEQRAVVSGLEAHFSAPVIEALTQATSSTRTLTVLDCDLVGFSALARTMAPDAVAQALRAYHGFVEAEVFARDGGVLKFTGDGVSAVFGMTGEPGPAAAAAIDCAEALGKGWPDAARGLFPGQAPGIAVGVEHGIASAGLAGSGRAMALLVTGAPLDRAAHLQSASRAARAPVLVGEAAMAASSDGDARGRARRVETEDAWAMGA